MERVLTSILRIASVSQSENVRLAISAQIFVAAGVLILFVINIVFATRLVRATHRSFGWHPVFGIAFKLLYVLLGITLIIVISATIQGSYNLDPHVRAIDRSLQLYGTTLLAIVATLPLPMIALTLLIPYSPIDEFGKGRVRTKVIILLISTVFLSIGAWYRCGITWQPPVSRAHPLPGYLGKGPFYVMNFLFEFQTVIMYAILRIDQRWHIPNGARGPGSYSRPAPTTMEMQDSRPTSANESKTSTTIDDAKSNKSIISIDVEKASPVLPTIPRSAVLLSPPPSRPTSFRPSLSRPASSRPQSQRQSLLQQILTKTPSATQKREWRASEESRIIRRLGGPWSALPSPTESTFSNNLSPTHSTFSRETGISAGTGLSVIQPPSIRDTLHEDWTPEIEWELGNPTRFLSLKKKSLDMLR
jgi:hypothetical protein